MYFSANILSIGINGSILSSRLLSPIFNNASAVAQVKIVSSVNLENSLAKSGKFLSSTQFNILPSYGEPTISPIIAPIIFYYILPFVLSLHPYLVVFFHRTYDSISKNPSFRLLSKIHSSNLFYQF